MLFDNCMRRTQVQIQEDDVDIERVHQNMFLGVMIDDKMYCKSHRKYVHNKRFSTEGGLNKPLLLPTCWIHLVLFCCVRFSQVQNKIFFIQSSGFNFSCMFGSNTNTKPASCNETTAPPGGHEGHCAENTLRSKASIILIDLLTQPEAAHDVREHSGGF